MDHDEFMTRDQAAAALGVSLSSVTRPIVHGHLEPITSPTERWGHMNRPLEGVVRASVDREKEWRARASVPRRVLRGLGDVLQWF